MSNWVSTSEGLPPYECMVWVFWDGEVKKAVLNAPNSGSKWRRVLPDEKPSPTHWMFANDNEKPEPPSE